MTTFEDRERAFEAKFAFDQDVQFRLLARRDKLFAQWAAEELRLDEAGRADLVSAVLHVEDGAGHDERLTTLVADYFVRRGRTQLRAFFAAALTRCEVEAQRRMLDAPVAASLPA